MCPVKPKKYFSHFHLPHPHGLSLRLEHLVHDPRFLPLLLAFALIAALIAMIILLAIYGKTGPQQIRPYYFYGT
jgi:hypothetical protein